MTFLIFKNSNKVINNFLNFKHNPPNIFKKKKKKSALFVLPFDFKHFEVLPYSLFPTGHGHSPKLL